MPTIILNVFDVKMVKKTMFLWWKWVKNQCYYGGNGKKIIIFVVEKTKNSMFLWWKWSKI